MGLDKVIFKPVAKGYRVLPPPVRASIGNALDNLTALVTIPKYVLQVN
jgi:phospholipid-binding lipoprotein MlaA